MRLIDADALRDKVLKWMPSDPCGIAEKERPVETDIVVSLMMEIDEAPTIEPSESTDQNVADVPSGDLIGRKEAISIPFLPKEHRRYQTMNLDDAYERGWCDLEACIQSLPSADRPTDESCRDCPIYSADIPQVNSNSAEEQIAETCDRPKGEWTEKEVMVDEDTNITEWQSARCSVCGRYHTTPYMYYFDNFNFCPNCGADMRGGAE